MRRLTPTGTTTTCEARPSVWLGSFFRLALTAATFAIAASPAFAQQVPAPHQDEASLAEPHSAIPARRIVVSIPDCKLALIENGRVVKVYRVAVGAAATQSPSGSFQIVSRLTDPTWYTPGKIVPPGKDNPLGTRWIGLSEKGFGIHGTNAPQSIGKAASHGCIRMKKKDVEELFELVRVGDSVELLHERDEFLAAIFAAETKVTASVAATSPAAPPVTAVAIGLGNE